MDYPEAFEALWNVWPRHRAKKSAARAWTRLNAAHRNQAFEAAHTFALHFRQTDKKPEFCPYLATWLNGERWNDDEEPTDPREVLIKGLLKHNGKLLKSGAVILSTGIEGLQGDAPWSSLATPDLERITEELEEA